jgi:hypothetical protein
MPDAIASTVEELKQSVEDALSRGFTILGVQPHGKDPLSSYFPHAVNSATRDREIALKPWHDGLEANYGVACGKSNITVVDCDHGLNSIAELDAWMAQHNLPETFIVISGRDGFGAHLYYTGAIDTTSFNIGSVTGELKSKGGYVVGPGSIHPSGRKYTIYKDISPAPLPIGLSALSEQKRQLGFTPKADGGELIPAGNRWLHLQSKAGTFRNAGLDEDGIYEALRNFAKNQCEDGENYPDEKIRALAKAAVTKFDATESTGVVIMGDGDGKKIDMELAALPDEAVEGDWIGDLTTVLTEGTFIPPEFMRATIKTILGASVDGWVGFPNHKDLHTRQWSMLISSHPESGKGESWKRAADYALKAYTTNAGLGFPKAGYFSSGERMVKEFIAFEGGRTVTYFDEMKTIFDKGSASGSTLFSKLIELYDRTDTSAGSLTHEGGAINHVSVSLTGGFTLASFNRSVAGKGVGGDGFLSRCVLAHSGYTSKIGDWPEINTERVHEIVGQMIERWNGLKPEQIGGPAWIPEESVEANQLRLQFQTWLREEKIKDADNYNGMNYTSRLESHFKRDLLLRVVFSPDMREGITADKVQRSIRWAEHELMLRRELWPTDAGNSIARMCSTIRKGFEKFEHMTKTRVQDYCNVARNGEYDEFNRAWSAMLKADVLYVVGKTHKKNEVFGCKGTEKEQQ